MAKLEEKTEAFSAHDLTTVAKHDEKASHAQRKRSGSPYSMFPAAATKRAGFTPVEGNEVPSNKDNKDNVVTLSGAVSR